MEAISSASVRSDTYIYGGWRDVGLAAPHNTQRTGSHHRTALKVSVDDERLVLGDALLNASDQLRCLFDNRAEARRRGEVGLRFENLDHLPNCSTVAVVSRVGPDVVERKGRNLLGWIQSYFDPARPLSMGSVVDSIHVAVDDFVGLEPCPV